MRRDRTHDLGTKSARAQESRESIVAGRLSQRIEAKESFIRCGARVILGTRSRVTGKHPKVIRERGSFARVEQVFDGDRSIDACEASVGPLEVQRRRPVIGLVLYDWP